MKLCLRGAIRVTGRRHGEKEPASLRRDVGREEAPTVIRALNMEHIALLGTGGILHPKELIDAEVHLIAAVLPEGQC